MPSVRPTGCASQLPGPGREVADCTPSAPSAREQNAFGRVLGRLHSSDSSLDSTLVESYRFRHAEWMIPDAWKWDRWPTDEGGWPQDQKAGHSQHEFEGVRPFPSSAKKNFHCPHVGAH